MTARIFCTCWGAAAFLPSHLAPPTDHPLLVCGGFVCLCLWRGRKKQRGFRSAWPERPRTTRPGLLPGGRCCALSPFYEPFYLPLSFSSSACKPEDTLLCFQRMEADDVSVREQLFHNRVRETIVSDAGLDAAVCRLICIWRSPSSSPSFFFFSLFTITAAVLRTGKATSFDRLKSLCFCWLSTYETLMLVLSGFYVWVLKSSV